ncbi:unnamed protein product [Heterobilharzia americana]|nr:unnamed protein product [Heterobilharzia americana]
MYNRCYILLSNCSYRSFTLTYRFGFTVLVFLHFTISRRQFLSTYGLFNVDFRFCSVLSLTYYKSVVWPGDYGIPKPWYFPFSCLNLRKPVLFLELPPNNEQSDDLVGDPLQTSESPLVLHTGDGGSNELGQKTAQVKTDSTDGVALDLLLPNPLEPNESLLGCTEDTFGQSSSWSQNYYPHEYFESEPIGLQVGVAIHQLRKVYSNKQSTVVAVSNLTMNIHEGQITVLLGHNGAGKTTTLSILTGLLTPTSGTAYIYGHNICKDIEGVRGKMGFCSQYDILYDTLTVEEHLYLSAHLKDCESSVIDQQRKKYAKTLSGGMKRRLSIGMTLIGDSKALILDEPTSGLDPEARRQVWDILQAERAHRTILITTHYMDEADHLGDRIAILASGELKCFGSPLFLKAKYGAGYLLSVNKESTCSSDHVLKLVQQYIPNALIRSDYGEEIRILLPLDSIDQFAKLFQNLELNKTSLGIVNFGVSVTTMEEVFHQVSEQTKATPPTSGYDHKTLKTPTCKKKCRVSKIQSIQDKNETEITQPSFDSTDLHQVRNHGFSFYLQQTYALIIKRYIFTKRNLIFVSSQIVVPIVFAFIALFLFRRLLRIQSAPDPRLGLSLDPYGEGLLVTYSNEIQSIEKRRIADQFIQSYVKQFGDKRVTSIEFNTTNGGYEDNLLKEIAIPNLFNYRLKSIIGLVADNKSSLQDKMISLRAYFQGESFHAAPISLNAVMNGFLRYLSTNDQTICPGLAASDTPPQIHVANQPLPKTKEESARQIDHIRGLILVALAGFPLASNMLLSVSYLASSFGFFPIYETVTKAKHLQFVCGVKLVPYWISIYVWDICLFSLSVTGILLCFVAFDLEQFAVGERFHNLVVLFGLFMWAALPQMYLLSRLFRSPTSGLVWLTAINVFTASIGLILVGLLSTPAIHQQALGINLMYFWIAISPSFCLAHGIFALFINYQFRQICDSIFVQVLCHFEPANSCCLKTCDPFCAYWTKNEMSYEVGGIGVHLTALAAHGLVYITLVLVIDSSIGRYLKTSLVALYRRYRHRYSNPESLVLNQSHDLMFDESVSVTEDIDVRQHRHLVESLPLSRLKEQTSLTLYRVSKTYGPINLCRNQLKKPAVDSLSLAILPSECFGLLGANGAGKTTIFRMITGDLEPSSGQILVAGCDLNRNLRKAQQGLGYCPQFDALLPYLTGYETLQLFARLRGIQEKTLNKEVDQLSYDLKLTKSAHGLVNHYSGGERRKLSVAVALVGGTPLVCLDEPTTGVDPISRRCIWNLLMKCRRQGRTLVLSSHSMEECEALCSRVSIFVNGRLKCLGTCQHLKARFGRGYSLNIQVITPVVHPPSSITTVESIMSATSSVSERDTNDANRRVERLNSHQKALTEAVDNVSNFIKGEFPDAHLVDQHQGVLQYHLPTDEQIRYA